MYEKRWLGMGIAIGFVFALVVLWWVHRPLAFVVALLGSFGAAAWNRRRGRTARPSVTFDAEGARRELRSGGSEAVLWADVVEIGIVTTGEGPFAEDVFWLLMGGDGTGCLVPNGEAAPLLDRMRALSGVDHLAIARAMGSTTEASFRVWKGERGAAAPLGAGVPSVAG